MVFVYSVLEMSRATDWLILLGSWPIGRCQTLESAFSYLQYETHPRKKKECSINRTNKHKGVSMTVILFYD